MVIYLGHWSPLIQARCVSEVQVILTELTDKVYQILHCSFCKFWYEKFKIK